MDRIKVNKDGQVTCPYGCNTVIEKSVLDLGDCIQVDWACKCGLTWFQTLYHNFETMLVRDGD